MTPVVKGTRFETDLAERALHLNEVNPQAALRFLDAVEAAIRLLARSPEIGPLWRYGNPYHPTRYLLVPGFHNYILFYRYERDEVRLGRLLHGAQDLRDILED